MRTEWLKFPGELLGAWSLAAILRHFRSNIEELKTDRSHKVQLQSQIRQVHRITRTSMNQTSQKKLRIASFLSNCRPSPGTRQLGASHHSSRPPDEFSCYGKVSNATSLSNGIKQTLETIENHAFSPLMLPNPSRWPIPLLPNFSTETMTITEAVLSFLSASIIYAWKS